MILYHGSILEVREPKILHSEIGRDFGFAFYTTDIQAQAERWAVRKAMIENRRPGRHCVERLRFEKINNQIAFCTKTHWRH